MMKAILSKTEFETIKYLSLFLSIIYPTNPINNNGKKDNNIDLSIVNEYKRFVYKLCLFLLGYNLDKVNSSQVNPSSKEISQTKKLLLIFELFIFYSCGDIYSSNTKKSYNISNDPNLNCSDWMSLFNSLEKEKKENENKNKKGRIDIFFAKKNKPEFSSINIYL